MKVSLTTVNSTLKQIGADETLVKGKGYFYFIGGESAEWIQQSVYVFSIKELSIEQWIAEYQNLKSSK